MALFKSFSFRAAKLINTSNGNPVAVHWILEIMNAKQYKYLQPYYLRQGSGESQFLKSEAYGSNAINQPLFPGLRIKNQQRLPDSLIRQLDQMRTGAAT
jgi:hypothetical protein